MKKTNNGGILLYIIDSITLNTLNIGESIGGSYAEMKISKRKWLNGSSYNPQRNINLVHLIVLEKHLVLFYSKFKNLIRLGVLSTEPRHQTLLKVLC